jgi:hypothetical protein
MSIVPNFILKRMYVSGSLRSVPEGIAFDIKNSLGPGILLKINKIKLGDLEFLAPSVVIKIGDTNINGKDISEKNPAMLFLNQTATCIVLGATLAAGMHTITLDLLSKEAGKVVISIQDQFAG